MDTQTEWLELVEQGQDVVQTGDNVKWQLGRLACRVAERWNRSKKTLIAFAGEIKMAHPRAIYEYHEVAEYFPESAYCELISECPMLTWSHFREEYRYSKRTSSTLDMSKTRLRSASDNLLTVEQYGELLRKDPNGNWITTRKRIPCNIINHQTFEGTEYMDIVIRVPKVDGQTALELQAQRDFITYLALRWSEQRI
jgi:hypothetical protein